jgi:hypothetical protein
MQYMCIYAHIFAILFTICSIYYSYMLLLYIRVRKTYLFNSYFELLALALV